MLNMVKFVFVMLLMTNLWRISFSNSTIGKEEEINGISKGILAESGWRIDPEYENFAQSVSCDFARVPINSSNKNVTGVGNEYPLVLSGLIDTWPAHTNWKKENFLNLYGDKEIRSGSESSIVYSGGVAENTVTVRELVLGLMASGDEGAFVFDTTVLQVIPELRADFSVPSEFSEWDHPANEEDAQMWHMLSLGPSRSGK